MDLSQVDFMASRGIGLLIANSKRLLKAGHKLVLLNPQAIVASVLKTSKADLLMPIVRDIAEAIHVLRGGPDGFRPAPRTGRSRVTRVTGSTAATGLRRFPRPAYLN